MVGHPVELPAMRKDGSEFPVELALSTVEAEPALICGALRGIAAAQPAGRQLVVPFESASRLPHYHWLSEGSAVILTDHLIALGAPAITREDRRRAFDRLRVRLDLAALWVYLPPSQDGQRGGTPFPLPWVGVGLYKL